MADEDTSCGDGAKISLSDVTEAKKVDGNGAFEVFNKSVELQLQRMAENQTISMQDVATIVGQIMPTTLQIAASFVIDKCKTQAEINFINAQTGRQLYDIHIAEKQLALIEAQIRQTDKQIELIAKQIENAEVERTLTAQRVITERANTDGSVIQAGSMLDAQKDLVTSQVSRTDSEVSLVNQKLTTEKAQTEEGIADPLSVIGLQNLLVKRQSDGFLRDAEQKAAKQIMDIMNVQISVGEDVDVARYGASAANSKLFIDKLAAGVGIFIPPYVNPGTPAPTPPTVTYVRGNTAGETAVTIEGRATPGSTIEIRVGTALHGRTTTTGTGIYSITLSKDASETFTYSVTAVTSGVYSSPVIVAPGNIG